MMRAVRFYAALLGLRRDGRHMSDGDYAAGLELAVGVPPPEDQEERRKRERFCEFLVSNEPTADAMAQIEQELRERGERADESPVTTLARLAITLSHEWLVEHRDELASSGDPVVVEALEVVGRGCFFISGKLHRALVGRHEAEHYLTHKDDPIQSDWNGSAKVALLSIDRSIVGWDVLARATNDPDAAGIAEHLRDMRTQVEAAFPAACKFQRPGFDDTALGRTTR